MNYIILFVIYIPFKPVFYFYYLYSFNIFKYKYNCYIVSDKNLINNHGCCLLYVTKSYPSSLSVFRISKHVKVIYLNCQLKQFG